MRVTAIDCTPPDRVYSQYRQTKALAWYQITRTIASELCESFNVIRNSYDIDTNAGAQLDVIGEIAGVNRGFIAEIPVEVSQFNTGDGDEFGDDSAQFSPTSVSDDQEMSDKYFRILLKAKIARNNSYATIDDIISVVQLITGVYNVTLDDNLNMSFDVTINGAVAPEVRYMLNNNDIVPRPQGVKFDGFLEVTESYFFTDGIGDDVAQFGDEQSQFFGFTT